MDDDLDLDRRLRASGSALRGRAHRRPPDLDTVLDLADRPPAVRPRRAGLRVTAAAAVVAALIGGAALTRSADGDPPTEPGVRAGATAPTATDDPEREPAGASTTIPADQPVPPSAPTTVPDPGRAPERPTLDRVPPCTDAHLTLRSGTQDDRAAMPLLSPSFTVVNEGAGPCQLSTPIQVSLVGADGLPLFSVSATTDFGDVAVILPGTRLVLDLAVRQSSGLVPCPAGERSSTVRLTQPDGLSLEHPLTVERCTVGDRSAGGATLRRDDGSTRLAVPGP